MPLTLKQLSELERALDKLEKNSARDLRQDFEQSGGESFTRAAGEAPDSGDRSVADLEADLEAADIQRHGDALEGVMASRTRLADGSYGVCIDCDADIDFERLKVNPTALRCVECQSQFEKTHESGSMPSL